MLSDVDLRLLLAVHGDGHGVWGAAMIAATVLGSGWTSLLLLALWARRATRAFAGALAIAIAAQSVVVWAAKQAVGRVRPWIALGLPAPLGAPSDPSFPSGHAAGSFCVAAFLVAALPATWPATRPGRRVLAALAFGLAALIALSRVYLGAHYPSDVVAGALVGVVVGAVVGRRHAASRARVAREAAPPPVGVEGAAKRG